MSKKQLLKRIGFEAVRIIRNTVRESKLLPNDPYIEDVRFARLFDLRIVDIREHTAKKLLEHFITRQYPKFYVDLHNDGPAIKEILTQKLDSNVKKNLAEADSIKTGKLRLLGVDFAASKTAFDWHFDPIARTRFPLRHWRASNPSVQHDLKPLFELNRHAHFPILAKAFFVTGSEQYLSSLLQQWENWMADNPPERGMHWYESLDIGFRCISWIWALQFILHAKKIKEDTFLRIMKYLYMQANHIYDNLSVYYSPNTHLTGEALALFIIGTWMPECTIARKWRRRGQEVLEQQIRLQVDEDGCYREQSTYYNCYTIDIYMQALILAERNGILLSPIIRQKINKMINFLMYISRPDGTIPRLGDDDGGRVQKLTRNDYYSCEDIFSTGSILYKHPEYKYLSQGFQEETLWMFGPDSYNMYNNIGSHPPRDHSTGFNHAGIHIHRSDWSSEGSHLIFDCGDMGFLSSGHAHADALSFELYIRKKPHIIDSGTYIYEPAPVWRDYFRGTSAHNTVTVDDLPQAEFGLPFKWKTLSHPISTKFVSLNGLDYSYGSHDGYTRLTEPIMHGRTIVSVKPYYWFIRDTFNGKGEHKFTTHFHLNCDMVAVDETTSLLNTGLLQIQPFVFGSPEIVIQRAEDDKKPGGWYSPSYGEKVPVTSVRISMIQSPPCSFYYFLIPLQDNNNFSVKLTKKSDMATVFTIEHGHMKDLIFISEQSSDMVLQYEKVKILGNLALIRSEGGKMTEFGGIDVQMINYDGYNLCTFEKKTSFWERVSAPAGRG